MLYVFLIEQTKPNSSQPKIVLYSSINMKGEVSIDHTSFWIGLLGRLVAELFLVF